MEPKFDVIYADPPWSYDNYGLKDHGAVRAHYPTMTLNALKALPVGDLAAKDCALFMWGTWPKLPEAVEVLTGWGFRYVTCPFVWAKTYRNGNPYCGLGYYTRSGSEFMLLGLRGSLGKPPDRTIRQVVEAPVAEHSVKPDVFYELIERLYPGKRRVELFARRPREGWERWGNEVDSTVEL